jgi:glutamine cyclotransferase
VTTTPTGIPELSTSFDSPLVAATRTLQPADIPVYSYEVVAEYPHDPEAFTQGLVIEDGVLVEGTGLRGLSTLREVDLETGQVRRMITLSDTLFGEGVTVLDGRIYQLTWQENVGLIYDRESFDLLQIFTYPTEGWGLTHDGELLIMSDGTATLTYRDPQTLEPVRTVQVVAGQEPVTWLNELEYVEGEVWANVWQTDHIARIDPDSGQVVGWIDLTGLLGPEDRSGSVDVLNGIAYDDEADRLIVTGKRWPKLFEITVESP